MIQLVTFVQPLLMFYIKIQIYMWNKIHVMFCNDQFVCFMLMEIRQWLPILCYTGYFYIDIRSIMHYSESAWTGSKDRISIKTKDPKLQHLIRGDRTSNGFSELDIKQIRLLYKCNGKQMIKRTILLFLRLLTVFLFCFVLFYCFILLLLLLC